MLVSAFLIGTALGPGVAIADNAIQKVFVTNTAANPVPVTGTLSLSGTPTVTVGNFPATQPVTVGNFPATQPVSGTVAVTGTVEAGATSVIIASGFVSFPVGHAEFLLPKTDLRAYKELTLYLVFASEPGQGCAVEAVLPQGGPSWIVLDIEGPSDQEVWTFVAPPFMRLLCLNDSTTDTNARFMLVGRPN
jgi:hypothetical protein